MHKVGDIFLCHPRPQLEGEPMYADLCGCIVQRASDAESPIMKPKRDDVYSVKHVGFVPGLATNFHGISRYRNYGSLKDTDKKKYFFSWLKPAAYELIEDRETLVRYRVIMYINNVREKGLGVC